MTSFTPRHDALLDHRAFLRNLASRLLSDPDDIEDVEQSTWLSSLTQAGPIAHPRSWLARVFRNHAADLRRRRRRVQRRESAAARDERLDDTTLVVERLEIGRRLVDAVMRLPVPQRDAILLCYYEELSQRAAAARLGITRDVLRTRLDSAHASLRSALDAEDGPSWRLALQGALSAGAGSPVTGLLVGSALGAGLLLLGVLWIANPFASEPETEVLRSETEALAPLDGSPSATRIARQDSGAFPPPRSAVAGEAATIRLRIGEGFVFGETAVRPDGDRSSMDLFCQDIHGMLWVACPQGGSVAVKPMTSAGLPRKPIEAAALLADAPMDLPEREVRIAFECRSDEAGVAFARSRDGLAFKFYVVEEEHHVEALRRSVVLAYEAVPQRAGGGRFRLPEVAGAPNAETLEKIRGALRLGKAIPGDSFSEHAEGDYQMVRGLQGRTVFEQEIYGVLDGPLASEIVLDGRGSIATEMVSKDGKILIDSYAAALVLGPMEGNITTKSYGFVYIDGAMNGTLEFDSYTTACVRGDVHGKIDVNSNTDLLIQGRLFGTLNLESASWTRVYLDGFYSAHELGRLGADHQVTLHIRSSDLAPGVHGDLGGWDKVVVADPLWNAITR